MAVACGVGQIGWRSLLITPQFGTRQKLTSIATNALLAPDPMLEQMPCEPEKCRFLCARACPTSAIPQRVEEKVSIHMGEQPVEYGSVVGCRWGCASRQTENAAVGGRGGPS